MTNDRRPNNSPTITETVHILQGLGSEYHRLSRLTIATMQHLLADQADAVAPAGKTYDGTPRSKSPTDDPEYGSRHDAMLARTAALAPYAYRGRRITDGIAEVRKSLREWQRCLDDAISDRPPRNDEDRPRCPGVTEDANGRLGGCGNLTEKYHTQQGVKYLPLCKRCRTQGKHT